MASIKLKSICKRYDGAAPIISKFNLEIQDREFVVLAGPSGCGKSTILKMITGLEEISEGELYIDDKLVNDVAPEYRDVAMICPNYELYPDMTIFENIAFGLKLRKMPEAEISEKVEEAAGDLGIRPLLDKKPKDLSVLQRNKVVLGRALVRKPKVLLMDQPLSNLDSKIKAQMRNEIRKIYQKLQMTVIYVTHDQIEAMTMGTRVVVIKDGVIQQDDSPQVLYEKPKNLLVADFIGSHQMNFVNVKVEKRNNEFHLLFGNQDIKIPGGKAQKLDGKNYVGKEVIMGIRPEHIYDTAISIESMPDSIVEAKVEFTEKFGAETLLYMIADENNITARVNSRSKVKEGDSIKVAFDTNKIYLFDCETENAIY